ncbi:hypothetical protein D3C80_1844870 [compost metagenome]
MIQALEVKRLVRIDYRMWGVSAKFESRKIGLQRGRGRRILFDVQLLQQGGGLDQQLIGGDVENIGEFAQDQQ